MVKEESPPLRPSFPEVQKTEKVRTPIGHEASGTLVCTGVASNTEDGETGAVHLMFRLLTDYFLYLGDLLL